MGTEERLQELLGSTTSTLRSERRAFVFGSRPTEDFAGFFRDNYGPVHQAFAALDEPGQRRLHDDLVALAQEFDRATGPSVAMPSEYLETIAIRG